MTREEIKQVAENYASQICNDCSAMLYCEGRNKNCVKRREREKIFADGAKWAEECSVNVWHNASEYPSKVGAILYRTTLGQFRTVCHGTSGEGIWKVFAKDYGVMRWAYISELLPKGGEE